MPPLPALTVVFSRPRLIACLLLVFMAAQATSPIDDGQCRPKTHVPGKQAEDGRAQ